MNRFDTMSKDAMSRVEEIMNSTKLNEFLHRKEEEEKKKTFILWALAIIGAVAAVAAIAYGVYRFFTPDYLNGMPSSIALTTDHLPVPFCPAVRAESKPVASTEEIQIPSTPDAMALLIT